MQDVLTTIKNRKSVRNYSAQAVPMSDVKQIVETAIWAPNAMNSQQWHFSVVTDANLVQKMSDACQKGMANAPVPFLQEKAKEPDFHAFFHAPAVIVITVKEDKFTLFDAGAAAENICLAAAGMGYATCITASTEFMFAGDAGLREELSIPAEYKFACAITLGVETEGPDSHNRERNPEVISFH